MTQINFHRPLSEQKHQKQIFQSQYIPHHPHHLRH